MSPLEQRFRDIQIVIITNFVIVLRVHIKRVDCKLYVQFCIQDPHYLLEGFSLCADNSRWLIQKVT